MPLYLDSFSGSYEQKVTQFYQTIKTLRVVPEMSLRQFDTRFDYTPYLVKKRVAATVSYRLTCHKMLGDITSAARLDDMMAFSNGLILRGAIRATISSQTLFLPQRFGYWINCKSRGV